MILSAFIIFWAALAAGILFIVTSACKLILSLLEEGGSAVRLAIEAVVFFLYHVCYWLSGIRADGEGIHEVPYGFGFSCRSCYNICNCCLCAFGLHWMDIRRYIWACSGIFYTWRYSRNFGLCI